MRNKTKDEIVDILLKVGVPAGVKGFTYIYDAMIFFDTDIYYQDGKICSLYADIAKKHNTTASRVERAMRHAFETAIAKGDSAMVEHYLDLVNTQNSNLLRTLYLRINQERRQKAREVTFSQFDPTIHAIKRQIFAEAVENMSNETQILLREVLEITAN